MTRNRYSPTGLLISKLWWQSPRPPLVCWLVWWWAWWFCSFSCFFFWLRGGWDGVLEWGVLCFVFCQPHDSGERPFRPPWEDASLWWCMCVELWPRCVVSSIHDLAFSSQHTSGHLRTCVDWLFWWWLLSMFLCSRSFLSLLSLGYPRELVFGCNETRNVPYSL